MCPVDASGCSLALRGSHLETLDFLLRVSWVELRDDGWAFSPLSAAFFGLLLGLCMPIHPQCLLTKTLRLKARVKNNQQPTTTTQQPHNNHHKAPILLKGGHLPRCAAQLLLLFLMAARDAGGGMSNARCRRERRLRSWWRHEAQNVAAALTAARHHSAGPREEVVTRREVRQEGEVHEENDGLRAQTTPLPGGAAGTSA